MEVSSARNKELQRHAGAVGKVAATQRLAPCTVNAKLAAFLALSQAVACKRVAAALNWAKAACSPRQGFLYSAPSPPTPLRASR